MATEHREAPNRRSWWKPLALMGLLAVLAAGLLFTWGRGSDHGAQAAHTSPTVIATIPVGTQPVSVGVNPTTNRIYVANTASNNVSVIDGATNTVIATVAVGASPGGSHHGVGVNPSTNKIYVANNVSNNVSVIDGATNAVVATISTLPAQQLQNVAVNPNTNKIYVTSNDPGGRVAVIDGASDTLQTLIGVAANPRPIVLNPNTNKIYVGHGSFFGRTRITLIDGATNAVSDCTNIGLNHVGMALNPTTGRIYLTRANTSSLVSVFDGACNPVIATVGVSGQATGVDVSTSTDRVYLGISNANSVDVIDGTTGSPTENTVVATVSVGPTSNGVGVNPNTDRVYVANTGANTVSVIADAPPAPTATGTPTPTATIPAPTFKPTRTPFGFQDAIVIVGGIASDLEGDQARLPLDSPSSSGGSAGQLPAVIAAAILAPEALGLAYLGVGRRRRQG